MAPSLHEYPCDVCGSNSAVEVPYCRLYTADQPIHICRDCGFVYVRYRRSLQELIDSWWSTHQYAGTYDSKVPAVIARQTYVAEYIDSTVGIKNKKVCDIGTGEGYFLEMVRDRFNGIPFGTETCRENCEALEKKGIKTFVGPIEAFVKDSKFKPESFDLVTIMWTLENCLSCRDLLKASYELVSKGGSIVVSTGSRILVPFKKPLHHYFSKAQGDLHCFRFSANTLRGILATCGFEVVHTNRFIDSDVLCLIAEKRAPGTEIKWQRDDYLQVYNFFERWHHESMFYRAEEFRANPWNP